MSACEIVRLLACGEISPVELVEISRQRIELIDPVLNALPTTCFERALDQAKRIQDGTISDDGSRSWLGGLPIAIKDLNDVAGVRTTYGSNVFSDHVPELSDYTVERLESNGAVIMAKSNTPEFGAGAATFNDVFGITCNPWDVEKNPGGSSGGSAVAVASGQVWGAQGSDLGGSLRIPASFCGVVGFRPTPGIVPRGPTSQPFSPLWVDGPIARNVADCALLLDAMSGRDSRDPMSRPRPVDSFSETVKKEPPSGLKIAYSRNLGITPVDPAVDTVFSAVINRLGEVADEVEEAHPDIRNVPKAFQTLRAAWLAADMADLLEDHEKTLKPELVWNIRQGMRLSVDEIGRATVEQGRSYREFLDFFETYDLLVTPATVVPPFEKNCRYPEEVNGQTLETYFDWCAITYSISLAACPAISILAGFTEEGLPVGLQIIAAPFRDADLLGAAAQVEELLGLHGKLPIDPV
ncbi:MAG: amidase [Rhodospirillales bacterium]